MMVPNIEEVLVKVTFTPAERAVLVEQATAINVLLTEFADKAKNGTGEDVGRSYLEVARHAEYIGNVVTTKFQHTAVQIEQERHG